MRAIVIYTSNRPVDVIDVPDTITVRELEEQRQRLDAAGVDYALLNYTKNVDPLSFTYDVDRYAGDDTNNEADADGAVPVPPRRVSAIA